MLLFRGLIPLSIVVITPVVGAVRGATLFLLDIKEEPCECSKKQHRVRRKTVELAGWIGKKALVPPKNKDQLPTTWKQALTKGALNFLPLSLVIAFCFTPSVSAKTFSEWHCLSYVYDGETEYSYLANDLSVRCDDSDEYDDIISVAWLFIAVWPIGMVAMYIALLVPCRNLLRDEHVESPLLRATAFLHRDYKIGYFWWEVASLMQRTTLTGWLLLIDDKDGIFRLLAAQLICLSFLVVLLALQPYKRYMDNTIAAACQVVFICIFIGGALVRIYNSILDDFEGSPDLAYRTLGVSSSEYLVLIMLGVAFTMLGTLVLTLACESYMRANQLRLANRWSVCTMNPPSVKWKPDGIYAAFLSHYKNEAASDARYMHDMLRKMLKAPVFLDSSSLSDLRDLITEGVHKSDTLVLLMTKGVLSRPWCLLELLETARRNIPVVLVQMSSQALMLDAARDFVSNLEVEMRRVNPNGLEFLHQRLGPDLSELKMAVNHVLDTNEEDPISFASHVGDNAMLASMKDLVERMAFVTGREIKWKGDSVQPETRLSSRLLKGTGSALKLAVPARLSHLYHWTHSHDDVVNKGNAIFIGCSRDDAVSHARVLRSALEVKVGRACAIGGGPHSASLVKGSQLCVILLTKKLLANPISLYEIWLALDNDIPLVSVAITGGGYDYEHAAAVFDDLPSALEHLEQGAAKKMASSLPEGCTVKSVGERLHTSLTAIIALSWAPAGSANLLNALVDDILLRMSKKKNKAIVAPPKYRFRRMKSGREGLAYSESSLTRTSRYNKDAVLST